MNETTALTQNHPITPPPELVDEWLRAPEYVDGLKKLTTVTVTVDRLQYIATQAARWGADMELDACCEWLEDHVSNLIIDMLRATRRPKTLSLKGRLAKAIADGDEFLALQLLNEAFPNG